MLYGAAQFSKDVDFLILASEFNFAGLRAALDELEASRIAVPPFDPEVLARGHAVHFRCRAAGSEGLRIDVMTRLRDLADFDVLWGRRTTITLEAQVDIHLLSVQDLVEAKKTQREKDWPMISALVEGHYHSLHNDATPERIVFWLTESRTPERLIELVSRFPDDAATLQSERSLLRLAEPGKEVELREALDAEVRAEQEKDRLYWEPLKRELAEFRRAERQGT